MSTKIVQRFIFGETIPLDAAFLFYDKDNSKPLVYEVPLKSEKKAPVKAMFQNEIIEAVIDHLNAVTGSKYTSKSKATTSLIRARLNEGRSLDDFKVVIDKKAGDWLEDPKMAQYLRPQTLFGTKFDGYLSQSSIEGQAGDPFTELDMIMESR
jgi:uncharacterized phage protein (TIGR02220 family)